ncbi:MAG TPA: V-type ATP synthase subunit F [Gaiellaceae bacterium]|jgi:vacuolar-type H+-ATPase subunit F/Vma7|nr:V-type ATP synthase subunit F [Gaiellaceae bacterium]
MRIVAIGEETELAGYALAGVEVVVAGDAESVRRAWSELGGDVGLVLLAAQARRALPEPLERSGLLWAVLPA